MVEKAKLLPAMTAGIPLILRNPLSVLVWGVIYIAFYAWPLFLLDGSIWLDLIRAEAKLFTEPGMAISPEFLTLSQKIQGVQYAQLLGLLLAMALIYPAIQRAVLRPEERGFFFLRFGKAELHTALLIVILYVLFVAVATVLTVLLMIPVIAVFAAQGGFLPNQGGIGPFLLTVVGLTFAVMLLLAYPAVRLGMAIPLSIGKGRLLIFEAWKFTRGYGLRLMGLAVAMMLVAIVVEIFVFVPIVLALVSSYSGGSGIDFAAFMAGGGTFQKGPLIAAGVLWAVFICLANPLWTAPWMAAYQRIAEARAAARR